MAWRGKLAHTGVLFHELAEFSRPALDSLRQETGEMAANHHVYTEALVSINCGDEPLRVFGSGQVSRAPRCAHMARISPILDRFGILLDVRIKTDLL